jgi:hypothetical protein
VHGGLVGNPSGKQPETIDAFIVKGRAGVAARIKAQFFDVIENPKKESLLGVAGNLGGHREDHRTGVPKLHDSV